MGGLNGLVNNAGIIRDGLLVKQRPDDRRGDPLSTESWNAVLGVNLTGATWMVREVVAKMVETESRPGVVVNLSQHLALRQPRSVQLRRRQGRARRQHRHLGPGVRVVRHPRGRGGAGHDRDPDDAGHEPEGPRRARRGDARAAASGCRRTSGWP